MVGRWHPCCLRAIHHIPSLEVPKVAGDDVAEHDDLSASAGSMQSALPHAPFSFPSDRGSKSFIV